MDSDPACRLGVRNNVVDSYFFSELSATVGECQATQWLLESQNQNCGKSVCSESSRSSTCSRGTSSSFSTSSTSRASTSSTLLTRGSPNYASHSHRMRDKKPHHVSITSTTKPESPSASGSTTGALTRGLCTETSSQSLISGNAANFEHPIEISRISDMGANAGLLFTDAAHLVLGQEDTE